MKKYLDILQNVCKAWGNWNNMGATLGHPRQIYGAERGVFVSGLCGLPECPGVATRRGSLLCDSS
jgi:hypothetical protein